MKDNKEILIAGCGTGKEAIYMAQEFKNSNITAIDLSLGSLSYAKKKAKDIGVNNLNFFHCDILNVKSLNKNFDIINCSGVLHHMDCPEDGLKSLIGSLKNSGIMNIGLYSRIARERISKGRDIIKSLNLENNREDIRKFRDLVKNELHEFKQFLNIRDFFSYYEVQDLLFHPREVLFDLIEIEKLLKDNNLKFIEFDQKYNEVKKLYQNNFPEDAQLSSLENWNSFEINFPDTFLGMYQFYIRKIH
jgi:ubiquinone/menaquinone biosynthesis C-methylase UbiE